MLKHLILHALLSKAPVWVLWLILVLFGVDLVIPDPIPFIDEIVLGWLSVGSFFELRRRRKIEEPAAQFQQIGPEQMLKDLGPLRAQDAAS